MAKTLSNYGKYTSGLLLVTIIGLAGKFLSIWIPNIGGVTLAIILGLIIGNIFKFNDSYKPGITFAKKKLLSLAIMLMGLELELPIITNLGLPVVLTIIIMVCSAITLGFIFGKLMGLSSGFSLLLGIGNGICGSSAIAATAPFLSKDEEEIGLSIGVVNLLGTIGIFLLPVLASLLNLSDTNSSIMVGGSLQAVGQVVAAGFSINDNVGNLATVVKMGRILMLGPTVLVLAFMTGENSKQGSTKKIYLPSFIIGFIIFSLLGSFNIIPEHITVFLKTFSKYLLTISMAAIGLNIKLSSLFNQGPKALFAGILVFICQLGLVTLLINFLI